MNSLRLNSLRSACWLLSLLQISNGSKHSSLDQPSPPVVAQSSRISLAAGFSKLVQRKKSNASSITSVTPKISVVQPKPAFTNSNSSLAGSKPQMSPATSKTVSSNGGSRPSSGHFNNLSVGSFNHSRSPSVRYRFEFKSFLLYSNLYYLFCLQVRPQRQYCCPCRSLGHPLLTRVEIFFVKLNWSKAI